jgi:pilus assembly protein CpaB
MMFSFLPVLGALSCGLALEQAPETVRILVARQSIPPGTLISEPDKFFKYVRYVKGDEPKDGLTDLIQVKGKVLNRTLAEDQPVKGQDLIAAKAAFPALPEGMRAVSIKLTPDPVVGGFILPGSRVDVLSAVPQPDGKQTVVKAVVQNVLVLAVDTALENQVMTATVAVTPEQAKKIVAAADTGKMSLVLRALEDEKAVPRRGALR